MSGQRLIDHYLAELEAELRVGRWLKRRILRELEAHLAEASLEMDEQRAIEQLGSPQLVAERFRQEFGRRPNVPRRRLALGALSVVALGGVAAVIVLLSFGATPKVRPSAFPLQGKPLPLVLPGHPRLLADVTRNSSVDPASVRVVAQAPTGREAEGKGRVLLLAGRGAFKGVPYLAPYVLFGGAVTSGQGFSPIAHFFHPNGRDFSLSSEAVYETSDPRPGGWELIRRSYEPGPLRYFQILGGMRRNRIDWMAVLGIARADIKSVTVKFTNKVGPLVLPVGPEHSFAYSSASPSTFARSLAAYDRRGELRQAVALPTARAVCTGPSLCAPFSPPRLEPPTVSFFQFKPTQTVHPGEHVVASWVLGRPSPGTGSLPLAIGNYPLTLYLVRNADAPSVRSAADPRLIRIGTSKGDLRFRLPKVKSGTYAIAASCGGGCARVTRGKTFFVLTVGHDIGGAPTPVMLLHVRSPEGGPPWFPLAFAFGASTLAVSLASILFLRRRRRFSETVHAVLADAS